MINSLSWAGPRSKVPLGWTVNGAFLLRLSLAATQIADGGFDILAVGDSILTSGVSSTASSTNGRLCGGSSIDHMVRILRGWYAPTIEHGVGYIPYSPGGPFTTPGAIGTTADNFVTTPGGSVQFNTTTGDFYVSFSGDGVGCREIGYAASATKYWNHAWEVTSSNENLYDMRYAPKYFQFVGIKHSNGGVVWMGMNTTTTLATIGGSAQEFTWDTYSATTEYGARSPVFTVNDTIYKGAGRGAFRPPASGSTLSKVCGIIHYGAGDLTAGIRMHQLSNPGTYLDMWSAQSIASTIAPFCTGTGQGATRGGLILLSSLINEGLQPYTKANYKIALRRWLDYIFNPANAPTLPAVGLIVPVQPELVGALTQSKFDEMVAGLYEIYEEYAALGKPIGVVDLRVGLGVVGSLHNGKTAQLGLLRGSDRRHLNNIGHARAGAIYASIFDAVLQRAA